ncbi:LacI family transcriptional regulator [Micromonospora sp. NBC_01699]|uniref:LacI family DNA-binding transcriptional regulator n=1 Tax=Micromonospora sp. NBC_01699 TaxID=2975984 RepID=UPI002E332412|nr:LacI family DNA-binding transcriptional regulator [Micromonospora sp. NBC_01699]
MTIYEVARRAGVSIATVSRALRDSDLVTPATRERVRRAVEELHYTPNRLARSLAEGRHAANGIVFPDLTGPYYAEVVLGYEEAASELGRSVLILATHGRRDAAAAVVELAGRVDGLAVMGNTVDDAVVRTIAATGTPLVLLARPPVAGIDTIRTRNERTAAELAAHLAAHGHRRIVFVGDPAASPDMAGRHAGLVRGLRAHGLPAPGCVPCAYDIEAGERAGAELMGQSTDAIVCANDELALGVHLAAQAAGRAVPDDLAVTGWDDMLAARFAGLTTVRQPMRALGATAARWLHRRIAERNVGPGRAVARRRVLPTQLVVRRSCGPHPLE